MVFSLIDEAWALHCSGLSVPEIRMRIYRDKRVKVSRSAVHDAIVKCWQERVIASTVVPRMYMTDDDEVHDERGTH